VSKTCTCPKMKINSTKLLRLNHNIRNVISIITHTEKQTQRHFVSHHAFPAMSVTHDQNEPITRSVRFQFQEYEPALSKSDISVSTFNFCVKSDWRAALDTLTLNDLMRISISIGKKGMMEWQPRHTVERWWLSGQRSRHPNMGPRN